LLIGEESLNWTKVGTAVGALLFVLLIVIVAVAPRDCEHKKYPFLCFATQLFSR